jgi:transcriptional regulator with GAF, ATPase, and Fis domain
VPLIANNRVHGILHLDSRDRYTFSQKDLSLVKTISNQTAMAIENNILIKEVEAKAKIQVCLYPTQSSRNNCHVSLLLMSSKRWDTKQT